MKKIVYKRPDGGISIIHPAEGARLAFFITFPDGTRLPSAVAPFVGRPVDSILRAWPVEGAVAEWAEPEEAFISRVIAKDLPHDATNVRVVEATEIPKDRSFRDAWKDEGGAITVDMSVARDIHRDRLRQERENRMAALDVAFFKALEDAVQDPAVQAIAAQKRALRDAPAHPSIDAAATPSDLKAAIPPALA